MADNTEKDNSRGRWLPILIPVVLIAVGLPIVLAIALNNQTDADNETEDPASPEPTFAASPTINGDRLITIAGLSFEPEEVAIAEGETLTFRNTSASEHRLQIDGEDIEDLELAAGETGSWKADETGEFELVCTIHPNQMRGTITVQ